MFQPYKLNEKYTAGWNERFMVNYTERGAGAAPGINARTHPEPSERVRAAAGEEL